MSPWATDLTYQVISDRTWKANQSWYRQRTVAGNDAGQTKLRATIRRNAYDDQSDAYTEVLTPGREWARIVTIPIKDLPSSAAVSYTNPDETKWVTASDPDVETLLTEAATVLGLL